MSHQENVLITGASSGIGHELALLFAADKSRVVLIARRKEKLESLAESCKNLSGQEPIVLPEDLNDPKSPDRLFEELSRRSVEVDVVVNNAGFGVLGSVAEIPLEKQLGMIQVNVAALTHLTRLFLPGMIERHRGGVLNVASVAAFQPGPGAAVYFATKAFVLSFTEALAEEVDGSGLKVTCLAPGPTQTEFGAVSGMDKTEIFRKSIMNVMPVAREGYDGFRRGKTIVVPGIKNRAGIFGLRFAPRAIVRKIVKKMQMEEQ